MDGWEVSGGVEQVYFESWTTEKKSQSYEVVCNYYCVVKITILSVPKAFPEPPGNRGSFNIHVNVMKQSTCSN